MVSIIANFYNSEAYIPRLIESIFDQTWQDWELICVNDCSPGGDSAVLHRYAADARSHGRIRVIDLKENVGISRAKHIGIAEARGEWITFSDGDDSMRPEAIESMVRPAIEHNLDMVVANCRRVFEFPGTRMAMRSVSLRSRAPYGVVIEEKEIREKYMRAFFGDNFLSSYAYWGKLYRADVLRRSTYEIPSTTLYEDIFFVMHAMLASRRIMFVPYEGYLWRWGGLSSGSTLKDKSRVTDFRAIRVAEHFNRFYSYRLRIMRENAIPDVQLPLLAELRHVLWSSFFQVAAFEPSDPRAAEVKEQIRGVITLPAYRDLARLPQMDGSFAADRFLRAVIDRDVDTLYLLAHGEYKRRWLKRLAKRFLSL